MTSSYTIFDPQVDRPLNQVPRGEAQAAYSYFIAQKDIRKSALHSLADERGLSLLINDNRELIQRLQQLLESEVAEDGTRQMPSPYVLSLCNDIGMFISDLLIQNAPQLAWGMHTAGKNDLSYQRPVVRGFNVENKNYSVDVDYLLCQYAHRLCHGGAKEGGLLWEIFRSALAKA